MFNLQLELTTRCNLSCIYCPRPFLARTKTNMSLNIFDKILDNFIDEATTVILSKDGEPLLHPRFSYFVKRLTDRYKGKIDLYTNGVFLKDEIVDFLGSLPNEFHILITEHWNGRGGIQLAASQTTRINIKDAIEKRYSNLKFHLTLHSVSTGENINENTWKSIWDSQKENYPCIQHVTINKQINPWLGLVNVGQITRFEKCPFVDYPYICFGVEGTALACCIDLNEELSLGNINLESKEIILKRLSKIKEKLILNDIKDLEPCRRCICT